MSAEYPRNTPTWPPILAGLQSNAAIAYKLRLQNAGSGGPLLVAPSGRWGRQGTYGVWQSGTATPGKIKAAQAKVGGGGFMAEGGGGSGYGGTPGSGNALAAVDANQPTPTGGMESVGPEIVENNVKLTERGPRFEGLDTFTPDEKLPLSKSPRFLNWNAIERPGSYCGRKGTGRMIDDGTTCVDSGASPITSTFGGLAIVPLPLNDPSDLNAQRTCAMLLGFVQAGIEIGVAGNKNICAVTPFVAWGESEAIRNFPGPTLLLSNPVAGTLRVRPSYTGKYTLREGMVVGFVKGVTIAYSPDRYPRDVDKRDDQAVTGNKTVTLRADRESWNGNAQNFDITGLAAGTYYVTVWAHTLQGTSEPVTGRMAIT